MIRAGTTLENPVTHIRTEFVTTSENSSDDIFVFDFIMPPSLNVPYGDHLHLMQEQRAEVLSGKAAYRLRGVEYPALPGDKVVFPRGVSHVDPWNVGDEEMRSRMTFEPGRDAEAAFEITMYLVQTGQYQKNGDFNLLQNALLLHDSGFQTYFAGIPLGIQRIAIPFFATIARLRGYRTC